VRVLRTSVHGLEMPVGEFPSCARGARPFLCPWSALFSVYCTCTTNLYYCLLYSSVGTTNHEIPFNIKGGLGNLGLLTVYKVGQTIYTIHLTAHPR
jgi:hypothetical protein